MKRIINIQLLLWLIVASFFFSSCCKQESIDKKEPINQIKLSQKITASDGKAGDKFGNSVSISGDYAIVGTGEDLDEWRDQGSAYIFYHSGGSWVQQAKLTVNDEEYGDEFGNSVSISGDYAIVANYLDDIGENEDQGSAYIFHRVGNTWVQQAKLTANDGNLLDHFGSSVSISGNYAIVGADKKLMENDNQGAAYVFHRSGSTWTQQAKLLADNGATGGFFGNSVSISGDFAIVGAYLDDAGGNYNQGSAYIFHRSENSWTQQAKLTAFDGDDSDFFGSSVSISRDYAIVGAYLDRVGINGNQGSAYIFHFTGSSWIQETKITAGDGKGHDNFGNSVSISGDYAIVGAFLSDNEENFHQGSAYVFHRSGSLWTEHLKLIGEDGASQDRFGKSVSISGDHAIIGAFFDRVEGNTNQGSAYIYDK